MTDKELLEKSASRFRLIAEDTLKITTGNLSHNLTSLRGFALRAAEIIDKHLKALQEEPVKRTPADIDAAMQEVEDKSRVFTEAHKGEDTDTILAQMRGEEPVSEDLGEYIDKLSKQFPEVSFAKLSRIAVRVAKWHNEHLWKHADGNNLPIIDREVIALLDNGKVVFAHRPPEFWDGKNIITGKVTRNYPKTYDKGGWNIPNIIYWLDVELPKEIEL